VFKRLFQSATHSKDLPEKRRMSVDEMSL